MGYYDTGRTDEELIDAFEAGTIEARDFPHESHVRVTHLLVQRYGRDAAYPRLVAGIKSIAADAGNPQAFHETITRARFELIAEVADLAAHPELFERRLLDRYYSPERLANGRDRWLGPDLHELRLAAPRQPPSPAPDLVGVMRNVPAAVAVLAARDRGSVHATTVSSVASVSRQPPLVLVCLAQSSRALALAQMSGSFALSFLASDQETAATRFADSTRLPGHEQFSDIPHHLTAFGPVLEGSAGWLGCSVVARYPGGDHTILVGEVAEACARSAHPLLRHDGAYL
jgi:flavin reductase (DIM6/NTAB) family NADH-FMN oxidoreductase RutF